MSETTFAAICTRLHKTCDGRESGIDGTPRHEPRWPAQDADLGDRVLLLKLGGEREEWSVRTAPEWGRLQDLIRLEPEESVEAGFLLLVHDLVVEGHEVLAMFPSPKLHGRARVEIQLTREVVGNQRAPLDGLSNLRHVLL